MQVRDNHLAASVRGKRALLVASTGGHLAQLHRLVPALELSPDSTWVTFDHPQSRSLLAAEEVAYIPYIPPRGFREAAGAVGTARKLIRELRPEVVLSTGAAIAAPFLGVGAARGVPAYYLESVSRFDGPSLTGRVLRRMPRVTTYTQHHGWAGRGWRPGPNVMAQFAAVANPTAPVGPLNVFVTLGTIKPYRFDRLVDAILDVAPNDVTLTWQLGETGRDDLPGVVNRLIDADSFDEAISQADVVITHAGVGSALRILELGKMPIMVPRDPAHGEHVDRHQFQVATFLDQQGLGLLRTPDVLSIDDLIQASENRVVGAGAP